MDTVQIKVDKDNPVLFNLIDKHSVTEAGAARRRWKDSPLSSTENFSSSVSSLCKSSMLVFVLGSSHLSRLFSCRGAADVNSTLQTLAESTCICVMWALSASHSSLPPTLIHTAPI